MKRNTLPLVTALTTIAVIVGLCIAAFAGPCPNTNAPLVMSDMVMDIWTWNDPNIPAGAWFYAVAADSSVFGLWESSGGSFLIHAYGNRPDTPEDEGFEVGEEVFLWINDNGHCARLRTVLHPIPWQKWEDRAVTLCAPGDINCDGVIDPWDYAALRDVTFRNIGQPEDWHDLDQDGMPTIVDVARLVNVIFRNGDPGTLKW